MKPPPGPLYSAPLMGPERSEQTPDLSSTEANHVMRRSLRFIAVTMIALAAAVAAPKADAQQALDIRAVVNDEAISAYDVEQRLNLVIRTSGLPDDPRVRRDLAPRIVNVLVEEALQLQEAKRLNITVAQKEIDAALALLERQNQIPPGQLEPFLKQQGIDRRTLTRQIEASIAWGNVARRQLARTITVTEEEVAKTLERIKANADKPRILAAEIFIAVDSPSDEANAKRNAQRIFEELGRGANFPQMARQFSQAATAGRGGDLGWVVGGELEPELDKALSGLPKGAVTEPIRTAVGYHILAARDRREPPAKSANETVVSLRQILLPLPQRAAAAAVDSQKSLADTIRASVRGCDEFAKVSRELGPGMSGDLGRLKLAELPEVLRNVVTGLDLGVPSPPVVMGDSVRVLIVCDRQAPVDATLPSKEEVERRLTAQRLELRARRYLRDLRDAAFLDIRA